MSKAKPWCYEIDFQCSFGLWPFRKTLDISAKGFEWCGELIPMKEITRLRWGVELRRGVILPKRVYVAVFGTAAREYAIKTKQKDFYEHLVERYWKAVGRRLLSEMLDGLAEGKSYKFASVAVGDRGITIKNKTIFGASQSFYEWDALRWGIANGCLSFVSGASPDQLLAGLSFIWEDNTHILSAALRLLEQSGDKKRLSKVVRNF